jgi:hypothetical protein
MKNLRIPFLAAIALTLTTIFTVPAFAFIEGAPTPTPSPSPSPSPTASPTPTSDPKPTLQLGGKGEDDGEFRASGKTCVISGICNNVDMIYWKFVGGSYRKVSTKGNRWSIKVGPLKTGNNFIRVYGVDQSGGRQTVIHNGVIRR